MLHKDSKDSFLAFLEEKEQAYIKNQMFSMATATNFLIKKLRRYTNDRDILFRDLTHSFVLNFHSFLKSADFRAQRKLSETSVCNVFKIFKLLYKHAVLGKYIITKNDPFEGIVLKKNQTKKIPLTRDEVQRINDLNLQKDSSLWHVRNYFMFSMYMAGMRISDVMNIKWQNINGERLVYTMIKTECECSLPIHEKAKEILNLYRNDIKKETDFIFPILDSCEIRRKKKKSDEIEQYKYAKSKTAVINVQLKTLAKKAGITKRLTCHLARHSFSTTVCLTNGVPVESLSQMLGHLSNKTTQIYAKVTRTKLNEDMTNLEKRIDGKYKLSDNQLINKTA
jgi:site-specific recombinase XerD